ncbi:hypothetical protein [Alterisphingorhabdus coralli]|uniref:Uncharacterized protein n=1 Tax=Alterisphingorhabdus coralli TaxID=3071408 RepID=A0AA97I230_9SPHN|nr:hypothetical protein [Parasphingorhabdus sp. SCSIO 66989]WOE76757.1 hypothetical protein RB602_15335 [Parasphingorhabdus sp. SCSIO 66989]
MTDQFALFSYSPAPMIRLPVDPDGSVIAGEADETFTLEHPRMAWDSARIQLHQHDDNHWLWSTSFNTGLRGSSYYVGAKWGRFAASKNDALYYAIEELRERVNPTREESDSTELAKIRQWLVTLEDQIGMLS